MDKPTVEKGGLILVKGTTNTKGLSTCIVSSQAKKDVEKLSLRGIGAGANNQIAKAVIIAKEKLALKKTRLCIDMAFCDVDSAKEDGTKVTAIEYILTFKKAT